MSLPLSKSALVGLLLIVALAVDAQWEKQPHADPSVISDVFNPSDPNAGYQRKYTITVAAKAEDCFFIEDVQMNQVLNFHFMVSLNRVSLLVHVCQSVHLHR